MNPTPAHAQEPMTINATLERFVQKLEERDIHSDVMINCKKNFNFTNLDSLTLVITCQLHHIQLALLSS
jgi:hypothetical protein